MNILKTINLFILASVSTILLAQPSKRFDFSYQKMGTQFNISFFSKDSTHAKQLANQCIQKVDALNQIFSDYEAESEISRLSNTAGMGKKVKVSPALWTLLKQSKKFAKKSKGAFDISIGPLSKLWRSMFRRKEIFNGVKIKAAKSKVNYRNIKLYPFCKKVKLLQAGMRLDMGGIAKGFTVDAIVSLLQKQGIFELLVDGGGDIYVGNPPPNKVGWEIKVVKAGEKGKTISEVLSLKNRAIASSGDTYRFLEHNGNRYSHIIDPRTGYGVINQKIITVFAPDCTTADATASTLSVLNEEETKRFLKKLKQVQVF